MNRDRVKRVVANMREEGLSQIIVSATPSVYYLTGLWIEPHERMLALYLDSDENMVLLGNELFAIEEDRCDFPCLLHTDNDNPVAHLSRVVKPGIRGIDKFWPAKFLLGLLDLRGDLKPCLGSGPLDQARMQKDQEEIARMRQASIVNDKAMAAVIGQLQAGVTEVEMAAYLTETYLSLGADFPVGVQLVAFGSHAADPHHAPGKAALAKGDCALFDIFTPVSRYWCDMTRTVYFGDVSPEEKTIYETVRRAHEAAIAAIRPGMPLSKIDAVARGIITEAGYGPYFTHRLGHGIGLECHEPPDCSAKSEATAAPGMIFSVEPGIYIPGKYGVRIENLVLVTEDGCESLNAYPRDLMIV